MCRTIERSIVISNVGERVLGAVEIHLDRRGRVRLERSTFTVDRRGLSTASSSPVELKLDRYRSSGQSSTATYLLA